MLQVRTKTKGRFLVMARQPRGPLVFLAGASFALSCLGQQPQWRGWFPIRGGDGRTLVVTSETGGRLHLGAAYLYVPTDVIVGSSGDERTLRSWKDIAQVADREVEGLLRRYRYARFVVDPRFADSETNQTTVCAAVELNETAQGEGMSLNLYEHLLSLGFSVYWRSQGDAPSPFHGMYLAAEAAARASHKGIWNRRHAELLREFEAIREPPKE